MNRRLLFTLCILAQIVFLCVMIRSNALILATGTKVLLETAPVDPHDLFRGEYARLRYRISSVEIPSESALKRGDLVCVTLAQKGKFWGVENAAAEKHAGRPEGKVVIRGTVQRVRPEQITVLKDFADVTEKGWLNDNPDAVRDVERIERRSADWKPGDTVYIPFTRVGKGAWSLRRWGIDKDENDALGDSRWFEKNEKRVLISATVSSIEQKNLAEVEYGIESYYVPEGKSRELERPRGGGRVTVEAAVDKSGDAAISRVFIDGKPIDF
jgi:uncharacterized membrane-anchored protein